METRRLIKETGPMPPAIADFEVEAGGLTLQNFRNKAADLSPPR
jgi:hypothetical protein